MAISTGSAPIPDRFIPGLRSRATMSTDFAVRAGPRTRNLRTYGALINTQSLDLPDPRRQFILGASRVARPLSGKMAMTSPGNGRDETRATPDSIYSRANGSARALFTGRARITRVENDWVHGLDVKRFDPKIVNRDVEGTISLCRKISSMTGCASSSAPASPAGPSRKTPMITGSFVSTTCSLGIRCKRGQVGRLCR